MTDNEWRSEKWPAAFAREFIHHVADSTVPVGTYHVVYVNLASRECDLELQYGGTRTCSTERTRWEFRRFDWQDGVREPKTTYSSVPGKARTWYRTVLPGREFDQFDPSIVCLSMTEYCKCSVVATEIRRQQHELRYYTVIIRMKWKEVWNIGWCFSVFSIEWKD